MQPFIELNAHHIGISHINSGYSCEDYSASYSDDQVSIIVISDGHGDKNCFRSAKGAAFACETAIRMCQRFVSITNHIDDINQCDFENLIVSLESDIADAWKETVLSHAAENPFSDKEMSEVSEQVLKLYKNGQKIEKAYGCTLILSMCTLHYWLSIQIGDGKSVSCYKDGVYLELVPDDENCIGNRSTSLCDSNAKESFRHYYSSLIPIASFVTSDGIEESFDQAGMNNFFYSIAYWLQNKGLDYAKTKLDELLPQISEGGSGDDVSVAMMVSKEETVVKPRQTLEHIYDKVTACENTFNQCKYQLESTMESISETNNQLSSLEKELETKRKELEEVEEDYKFLNNKLMVLYDSILEHVNKIQQSFDQMEKVNQYKALAERFWFAEYEKLGLNDLLSANSFEAENRTEENVNQVINTQEIDTELVKEAPSLSVQSNNETSNQETEVEVEISNGKDVYISKKASSKNSKEKLSPDINDNKRKSGANHIWPFPKNQE